MSESAVLILTKGRSWRFDLQAELVWDEKVPGLLRLPKRWELLRRYLSDALWPRSTSRVVAIDRDAGTITLG